MISKGKSVSIFYRLTDDKGQELDKTEANEPFTFVQGEGQVIQGLEKGLDGKSIGEKLSLQIAAAEAYGEIDENLKTSIDRSQFPAGQPIEIGDQFQVQNDEGASLVFEIEKIDGDTIYINGNHPLAGQNLNFEVEIVDVR